MKAFLIGFMLCTVIVLIIEYVRVVKRQQKELKERPYANKIFSNTGEGLEELNQYRYKFDRENQKELDWVLYHAKCLLDESKVFDYPQNHPIFSYIRTLIMKVQTENDLNVIRQNSDRIYYDIDSENRSELNYSDIYFRFLDDNIRDYYLWNQTSFELDNTIEIELGRMPILSKVWRADRLVDSLSFIGSDVVRKNNYLVDLPSGYEMERMNFKQDNNHIGAYQYPLGFVYIYNGNHSVNAGIMKGEGKLKIKDVHDLSGMFERYKFDGNYLKEKKGLKGSEIWDNVDKIPFELGAVFEIGRILLEYPELFPDEVKEGLAKQKDREKDGNKEFDKKII